MRYTLSLPTDRVDAPDEFTSGAAIREMAAHAEACGFDAVHVTDHPAPDAKWLDHGGHHAADALIGLTWAAAATTTLLVRTHVYIVAYRNPFVTAKAVATLDHLSNGRLVFGVAAGYLRPEFDSLGVDYERRNEIFDEYIQIMIEAWTGETVVAETPELKSRGTVIRPLVEQHPHPPLWVGGNSKIAMRRAVEWGQGWVPFANPSASTRTKTPVLDSLEELERRIGVLHELADEAGRTEPLDICFAPFAEGFNLGSAYEKDGLADEIGALDELGVTWIAAQQHTDTRVEWMRGVEDYANTIIAKRG